MISPNGDRSGKALSVLQDLNVLEIEHNYTYTSTEAKKRGEYGEAKKYGFTEEAQGISIIKTAIKDKAFIRRIEKARAEQVDYYLNHPLHQKILFNLQDITVSRNAVQEAISNKFPQYSNAELT